MHHLKALYFSEGFNLIQTVTTMDIKPCNVLEIGCGTGNNSIWLAQKNFNVIGIDASEIAIQKALEKASKATFNCTFTETNFLKNKIEGAPFGFVFDLTGRLFQTVCAS